MTHTVLVGDCLDVMRGLDAGSVGAVVTDPPYHLTQASRNGSPRVAGTGPFGRHRVGEKGFMGKTWDGGGIAFTVELWAEVLRVMRAGAYLLAFGGTRTFHRLTCAVEDAGFEVRDVLCWLYGSGFPKHASALKPAWEPIILARKPAPRATPLNIDACRLGVRPGEIGPRIDRLTSTPRQSANWCNDDGSFTKPRNYTEPSGRWPANVVLDEEAAEMVDEQTGDLGFSAGTEVTGNAHPHGIYGERIKRGIGPIGYGDMGGASRFFYCAKASREERDAGLHGWPLVDAQKLNPSGIGARRADAGLGRGRNQHPTVKPLALMRWLVRLVTPPNGVVLDPFCGSGSTGCAAVLEGRAFIGIEREPEYADIARARIRHAESLYQPGLFDVA